MVLTRREVQILNVLITLNREIDMEFLAEEFSVSLRTIRYNIENLNYYLKMYKFPIIEKSLKGKLSLKGEVLLRDFLKEIESKDYKYVEDERMEYIFTAILFSVEEKLNIMKLASFFQVSELTVKNDIKKLKTILKKRELTMRYNNSNGFYIDSDELKIRKEKIKVFIENLFGFQNNENQKELFINYKIKKLLNNYMEKLDQDFLKNYLKSIENMLIENTSNEVFELLIIYFSIAILRISKENIILKDDSYNSYIIKTNEYKMLKENIEILENKNKIIFNEKEILKLAEYFLGSHTYNYSYTFYENWIEVEILVRKLIGEISKNSSVDISNDKVLFDGLLNHIKPTIYRIKNDIYLPNIIFEEVYLGCEELFLSVKRALIDVEKYIGHKINDDEVALFTVHFKLAIDRIKEKNRKFNNILLVCGTGYASSNLLAQELSDCFDIKVVDLIPYYKLKDYNLKNVDFILSTVKIAEDINIEKEIVRLNVILSEKDKIILEKKGFQRKKAGIYVTDLLKVIKEECSLSDLDKIGDILVKKFNNQIYDNRERKINKKRNKGLLEYLKEESIFLKEKEKNWKNVVNLIGKMLIEDKCVTETYVESMKELIEEHGAFMILDQRLMILHAENKSDVLKTGVSFMKLDNPITFPENKKLKYIFGLACFSKEEITETLNDLVVLSENDEFFIELEKEKSKLGVLNIIKKYLEKEK